MDIKDKQITLLNELYRSFDFLNKHFCQGKLEKPLITIQGDRRGSTYGWFGPKFWKDSKDKDSKINELNLTAETLHREPTHVLETLLHEMAHLKNAQENIPDCTATQYHNKKFKEAAEFFGLKVSKMKGKGYAKTGLDSKALTALELLKPKKEAYCITRRPPKVIRPEPKYISLQVSIEYQDKVDFLIQTLGKKREMTEEAIDLLYAKYNK